MILNGYCSFIDSSCSQPESGFENAAAFEGAAEGDLIGVLKVAADGEATGESGDLQLQRFQ